MRHLQHTTVIRQSQHSIVERRRAHSLWEGGEGSELRGGIGAKERLEWRNLPASTIRRGSVSMSIPSHRVLRRLPAYNDWISCAVVLLIGSAGPLCLAALLLLLLWMNVSHAQAVLQLLASVKHPTLLLPLFGWPLAV